MTLRDYTDLMSMTPQELTKYALECAKLGVLSVTLTEALADTLEDMQGIFELYEKTRDELARAEERIEYLEGEARELMRRLDRSFI